MKYTPNSPNPTWPYGEEGHVIQRALYLKEDIRPTFCTCFNVTHCTVFLICPKNATTRPQEKYKKTNSTSISSLQKFELNWPRYRVMFIDGNHKRLQVFHKALLTLLPLNTGPLYGPFTAKHDYSRDTRFSPFTANTSIVMQSLFLPSPRTHISLGSGSLCIIVGNNIFYAKHLQG